MNVCDQQEASLQALQVMLCFTASLFRRPLTADACAYLEALELEEDDYLCQVSSCRQGLTTLSDRCADPEALTQTSVEFHRLFVGPHHVPCPPWGSIYLDEGRLFGPTSLEVARLYARHGFAIPEGKSEPSDHIAYELSFLAELLALAESTDDAIAQRDATAEARQFLDQFVIPWFPLFAESVRTEDRDGLYRGLVEVTDGLLQLTTEVLEERPASSAN